jgi:demethylmenaquinone methyltransferase/2-methoxy-6-polyprenyl-1,4-benzoquinol methylase
MTKQHQTTDFGYRQVAKEVKTGLVAGVFHSVAAKYDLMNDLMSLGLHRLWKRLSIELSAVRPGQWVLDIAGGTGDLAAHFSPRVGEQGRVVLLDINSSMLAIGRDRLTDRGLVNNLIYIQADGEFLPFSDHRFDLVTIAFGLRNITDKARALTSMYRVLKPGGRLLVLEFSKVHNSLLKLGYDFYSFNLLPKLGKYVANDEASYQYLVESIRMHPDQQSLKQMMVKAGFSQCDYHNIHGGVVALHKGVKI